MYQPQEHKTFLQVLQEGKDVYRQTYDVVIVEVRPPRTFQKRTGGTFTSQILMVDDGTAPMPLRVNPIMTYEVGQGFHLEGCYIKKQNGYWRAAVAQPPKGSMTLLPNPPVKPSGKDFRELLMQFGQIQQPQNQNQAYSPQNTYSPQNNPPQPYQNGVSPFSQPPYNPMSAGNGSQAPAKIIDESLLPDLSTLSIDELYALKKRCRNGSDAYWAINDRISLMRVAREENQMRLMEALIAEFKALEKILQPVAQALINFYSQNQSPISQPPQPVKTQIVNFSPQQAQQEEEPQDTIPSPEELDKMGLPEEAFDPNFEY